MPNEIENADYDAKYNLSELIPELEKELMSFNIRIDTKEDWYETIEEQTTYLLDDKHIALVKTMKAYLCNYTYDEKCDLLHENPVSNEIIRDYDDTEDMWREDKDKEGELPGEHKFHYIVLMSVCMKKLKALRF